MLSFAESLLAEAGIEAFVFDGHTSVIEGSLGILPRRLMVTDEDGPRAERILTEGFARAELRPPPPETSEDRFLNDRITVRQPLTGFRAGLDAVMLAAAIPAGQGDQVLELGAGVGTASLCLAARIDAKITGAEIDPDLTLMANDNAIANGLDDRAVFVSVDIFDLPADMKRDFAHVFCNPPFHGPGGQTSPHAGRARALEDQGHLADWMAVGLKRTAPGGTFTFIVRADRMSEVLSVLPATGVQILPLWPRPHAPAKRVIIQVTKGSGGASTLLPGLVLHAESGGYTPQAEAILRGQAWLAPYFRGL